MGFSLAKLKPENWSRDIAMDLGTASVLVFVEGKGIVLNEPSVVAVDTTTDRVVKVGRSAMEMLGRTPEHIEATRPLADGTMTQYEVTLQMLKYFIRRACGRVWIPPRVIICVPTGISEVQMRAIMDASREAGARRTYRIDEPRAAALGARLKFRSPVGHMIVNIGGGISNVAVLSMGGVVVSDNIPVGGDRFDQAIMNYVRRRYGVLIGERTAEDIKIQIGHVFRHERPLYMRVCGRSLAEGLPREILLSSKEMIEALAEPITSILDSVVGVVERTPPALVGDILEQGGITMTGGGSLLRGLDQLIEKVTGIPTRVADQPVKAAVLGAGRLLRDLNGMPEGMIDIPMRPTASRETARPDRDHPRSDRDYPRADRDRRDHPRSDRGNSYNRYNSYDSGSRDSRGSRDYDRYNGNGNRNGGGSRRQ